MAAIYRIRVSWVTTDHGGRKNAFAGRRYTPTARLVGEQEHFSVVVEFSKNAEPNPPTGTLRLLNSDLVEIDQQLHPGLALDLMEGRKIVARCVLEHLEVGAA